MKTTINTCEVKSNYSKLAAAYFNPFPNNNFQTLQKLRRFADDNFDFSENGRKLLELVENTVGKGEIARYEQFLLFPQCFHKTYNAGT